MDVSQYKKSRLSRYKAPMDGGAREMVLVRKVKENRRRAFSQSLLLRARNTHTHTSRFAHQDKKERHRQVATHPRNESCHRIQVVFPCMAMQKLILTFHLPYYVLTEPTPENCLLEGSKDIKQKHCHSPLTEK